MAKIYSYKKVVDAVTTKQLDTSGIEGAIELCEINGLTYVSVPDAAKVAVQDAAIEAKAATLDAKQMTEIRAASYVVRFIKQQVRDRIREKYDLDDELKLLRLRDKDAEAWSAYDAHVEECRAWGEAEIQKLGI
jgi:hypothetical protein